MVDMLDLVKRYYYHPLMGGSNSIKAVLPAVMSTSAYLREKYRAPVDFGTNLQDEILWKYDDRGEAPVDPYKLLPPLFDELDLGKDDLYLEREHIEDGGAAMIAFAQLQFTEMDPRERNAILRGLLRYCELDTLAMVMICEHWRSLKEGGNDEY
jgi:hypothetical protein